MTPQLNAERIKQIFESNDTAKGFRKMLSERERFRRTTNVKFLSRQMYKNNVKFVEEELLQTLRELESAHIGKLNRNGIFSWFYNLKDVAKMAENGQMVDAQQLSRSPKKPISRSRHSIDGLNSLKHGEDSDYVQIVIPKRMLRFIKTA